MGDDLLLGGERFSSRLLLGTGGAPTLAVLGSAIAAAGIIAPVLGSIDVAPIAIGLVIASGAMFALTVNSNFFWMFKSLLGLTTKGALKTMTTVTSIASLVSLPPVILIAFVV